MFVLFAFALLVLMRFATVLLMFALVPIPILAGMTVAVNSLAPIASSRADNEAA